MKKGTKKKEKNALEEAQKMMFKPMKDLPPLAYDFMRYLASQVGFCGETCLTAYAIYCQMVLKMKCEDEFYKVQPRYLDWWEERGYTIV